MRRDQSLRQIPTRHRVLLQIQADLLPRLSHGSRLVIGVRRVLLPAGQGDVARPAVSLAGSALDEEDFRFAMLDPFLREEVFEGVCFGVFGRPMRVGGFDADCEGYGGAFFRAGRGGEVGVVGCGEVLEELVEVVDAVCHGWNGRERCDS